MKKIFSALFFAIAISGHSQDITILEGELGFLRGQTEIDIQFDYENIAIEGGGTEKQFKQRKIEYLNNKEAGRGDKFERNWNQFRVDYFEPKFTETFVKYSRLAVNNENAAYSLIFKATRFEDQALLVPPNEEAKPTNKLALMDGEAWIVDRNNPDKVLAKIAIKKIPGRDAYLAGGSYNSSSMANYDVRVRLSFTYAKAGKELGAFVADKIK
ncbi:MAG: hypothetical protein HOP37_10700 [Cyclobacteriaceae bacterium]|nr:hypothetical protein [Cyclobacteriaceae bacterium]